MLLDAFHSRLPSLENTFLGPMHVAAVHALPERPPLLTDLAAMHVRVISQAGDGGGADLISSMGYFCC